MIPRTGEVLLLQMDGHLTVAEFNKAMEYAVPALEQIYQMQKDALRRQIRPPRRPRNRPKSQPPNRPRRPEHGPLGSI